MKYMISWFERTQGSPVEYENAQKRILVKCFVSGRRQRTSRSSFSWCVWESGVGTCWLTPSLSRTANGLPGHIFAMGDHPPTSHKGVTSRFVQNCTLSRHAIQLGGQIGRKADQVAVEIADDQATHGPRLVARCLPNMSASCLQ